jgi:hypothetical protein
LNLLIGGHSIWAAVWHELPDPSNHKCEIRFTFV